MKVRNRVQEVRKNLRYSQRLLSKETGVAPLILRRIEADNGYEPGFGVVRRVSEVLDRTDLFWLERTEEPPTDQQVSAG
jgi:transcriptional regulator with XRE-family HTH domain